jgi:hypothetical protein
MIKQSNNKARLLGGASTLLLISFGAGLAQAQTVTTTTTAITLPSVDGVVVKSQENTNTATATVNDTSFKSENSAVTGSSISVDSNSATAPALNNTATDPDQH